MIKDRQKWSTKEIKLLREYRAKDLSYRVIAPLIGRSEAAVKRQCGKQGWSMLASRRVYGETEVAMIRRLRDVEKLSFGDIGRKIGRAKDSVADCYYRHSNHQPAEKYAVLYEDVPHRKYLADCLREAGKQTVGDLKAWYRTACEHAIAPDYTASAASVYFADSRSLTGSQAAMCSER